MSSTSWRRTSSAYRRHTLAKRRLGTRLPLSAMFARPSAKAMTHCPLLWERRHAMRARASGADSRTRPHTTANLRTNERQAAGFPALPPDSCLSSSLFFAMTREARKRTAERSTSNVCSFEVWHRPRFAVTLFASHMAPLPLGLATRPLLQRLAQRASLQRKASRPFSTERLERRPAHMCAALHDRLLRIARALPQNAHNARRVSANRQRAATSICQWW